MQPQPVATVVQQVESLPNSTLESVDKLNGNFVSYYKYFLKEKIFFNYGLLFASIDQVDLLKALQHCSLREVGISLNQSLYNNFIFKNALSRFFSPHFHAGNLNLNPFGGILPNYMYYNITVGTCLGLVDAYEFKQRIYQSLVETARKGQEAAERIQKVPMFKDSHVLLGAALSENAVALGKSTLHYIDNIILIWPQGVPQIAACNVYIKTIGDAIEVTIPISELFYNAIGSSGNQKLVATLQTVNDAGFDKALSQFNQVHFKLTPEECRRLKRQRIEYRNATQPSLTNIHSTPLQRK